MPDKFKNYTLQENCRSYISYTKVMFECVAHIARLG